MKQFVKKVKHLLTKKRKGTNLIELLGVMAVIAIISVIAVGGITAARDSANETSVQSDIRVYQTAIQQVLMQHPEVMKFTATKPANAVEVLVGYVNDQLESQWKLSVLPGSTDSGLVAGTDTKRDAWGNPYGFYVYFDDRASTYTDANGAALSDADSVIYMAVVSGGKNASGGPLGVAGDNYDATTRQILSASAGVNNTDGQDDIGAIVRVLNSDVRTATFGQDSANLGKLSGIQWIFGVPSSTGGICHDFETETDKTATMAGSIDQYYDSLSVTNSNLDLFGTWS